MLRAKVYTLYNATRGPGGSLNSQDLLSYTGIRMVMSSREVILDLSSRARQENKVWKSRKPVWKILALTPVKSRNSERKEIARPAANWLLEAR